MNVPFFGKDRYFQRNEKEILEIVKSVYSSGRVIMGPEVDEFEKKVAAYCGRKYGVAVGSCTDALYFSLVAAGIEKGDEVLVTSLSFLASVTCILRVGAIPVFVDVDPETYLMDLNDMENKITPKTKAIVAVDIFGQTLDFEKLEEIGKKHNLLIIEDAAQSIGSKFKSRMGASLGLCSCVSFDPTKVLSAQGNGGVVVTDDLDVYSKVSKLRYHGKNFDTGNFDFLGYNSRIATLQAAILSYNLDKLEDWIEKHREIAQKYISGLSDLKQLVLPIEVEGCRHIYHKFVMKAENRDELKKWLSENNIQTRIHYSKALFEEKLFENHSFRAEGIVEVGKLKSSLISLPIHPWLSNEEADFVVSKVKEFYDKLS